MFQPTLRHFLLRQKTLALYRQAIRASQAIADQDTRRETITWVRSEIERNSHVTDVNRIEELIQHGRRDLKQIFPGR